MEYILKEYVNIQIKKMTCYITSYYDIGRDKWNNKFARSFEDYIHYFEPFIDLFNSDDCREDEMIVFIDEKYHDKLNNLIESKQIDVNITLIILNENMLYNKFEN